MEKVSWFVSTICDVIDMNVVHVGHRGGDKREFVRSKTNSLSIFKDYLFKELWEDMGLNKVPEPVSNALMNDIEVDVLRWLWACVCLPKLKDYPVQVPQTIALTRDITL